MDFMIDSGELLGCVQRVVDCGYRLRSRHYSLGDVEVSVGVLTVFLFMGYGVGGLDLFHRFRENSGCMLALGSTMLELYRDSEYGLVLSGCGTLDLGYMGYYFDGVSDSGILNGDIIFRGISDVLAFDDFFLCGIYEDGVITYDLTGVSDYRFISDRVIERALLLDSYKVVVDDVFVSACLRWYVVKGDLCGGEKRRTFCRILGDNGYTRQRLKGLLGSMGMRSDGVADLLGV